MPDRGQSSDGQSQHLDCDANCDVEHAGLDPHAETVGRTRRPVKSLRVGLGMGALLSVLIAAPLAGHVGGIGRVIGDGLYLSLFLLLLIFCIRHLLERNNLRAMPRALLLSGVLIIGVYALSSLWSPYRLVALRNVAAASSILFIFFVLTNLRWRRVVLLGILIVSSFLIVANFAYWILDGMAFRAAGLYTQRNSLAAVAYYVLFFSLAVDSAYRGSLAIRAFSWSVTLIASALVVAAGSRAVFGAALATTATCILWRFITRGRIRYLSYFVTLLASVIVVTLVYAYLQTWLVRCRPVECSGQGSDRREPVLRPASLLERAILLLIAQRPLLGWGSGALSAKPASVKSCRLTISSYR